MYYGIGSAPFTLLLCEACATVLMSADLRHAHHQLTSWLRCPDQGVSLADRADHSAAVHFGENHASDARRGDDAGSDPGHLLQLAQVARARRLPRHARPPRQPPGRRIAALGNDADVARADDHPPHGAIALWGPPHHASERLLLCHGGQLRGPTVRSLGPAQSDRPGATDGRNRPVGARGVLDAVAVAARNPSRPGARSPFRAEGPAHSSHVAGPHDTSLMRRVALR